MKQLFYTGQSVKAVANGAVIPGILEKIEANCWGVIRYQVNNQWYDEEQINGNPPIPQMLPIFMGKIWVNDLTEPPIQLVPLRNPKAS